MTRTPILAAPRDCSGRRDTSQTAMQAIASPAQVSARLRKPPFGSQRGVQAVLVDPLASTGLPRDLINQLREGARHPPPATRSDQMLLRLPGVPAASCWAARLASLQLPPATGTHLAPPERQPQ